MSDLVTVTPATSDDLRKTAEALADNVPAERQREISVLTGRARMGFQMPADLAAAAGLTPDEDSAQPEPVPAPEGQERAAQASDKAADHEPAKTRRTTRGK